MYYTTSLRLWILFNQKKKFSCISFSSSVSTKLKLTRCCFLDWTFCQAFKRHSLFSLYWRKLRTIQGYTVKLYFTYWQQLGAIYSLTVCFISVLAIRQHQRYTSKSCRAQAVYQQYMYTSSRHAPAISIYQYKLYTSTSDLQALHIYQRKQFTNTTY